MVVTEKIIQDAIVKPWIWQCKVPAGESTAESVEEAKK